MTPELQKHKCVCVFVCVRVCILQQGYRVLHLCGKEKRKARVLHFLPPARPHLPELSDSPPAPWGPVAPGHLPREGGRLGVRRRAPEWAFVCLLLHRCCVTSQSHLLCVKERSHRGCRWRRGDREEVDSRHRRPVPPPPPPAPAHSTRWRMKEGKREMSSTHEQKNPGEFSPYSQFPVGSPPLLLSRINTQKKTTHEVLLLLRLPPPLRHPSSVCLLEH